MATDPWIIIPEHKIEGKPLGRHIYRPEGWENRAMAMPPVAPATTMHTRHCPPFNQGEVGSCTGNAAAGALMTDPLWVEGRNLTEADALNFYSQATHFSSPTGDYYPPNDVGSSGFAVAEALVQDGLIKSSQHVTDLNTALAALTLSTGIFGVSWMDTFDNPLPTGEVPLTPSSQVRGGHEIQAFGINVEEKQVWFYQSWGATWGPLGNGTFWMSFDTLDHQLSELNSDGTFFTK